MRRPIVAGNWKMHGSRATVSDLLAGIQEGMAVIRNVEVIVCPPFVYLDQAASLLSETPIALGGQNLCQVPGQGAYTGEISGDMLRDLGCGFVIVGHSERRNIYGESDDLVAAKAIVAHQAGLIPVFCVGELLEERESGETEKVVGRQLDALLETDEGLAAMQHSVIAYEPVWAIGTGKTATPEQAQEVHAFIRQRLAQASRDLAEKTRILYGGSVKPGNAAELFGMADIDGGLIGGASLKAADFLAICRAADS